MIPMIDERQVDEQFFWKSGF